MHYQHGRAEAAVHSLCEKCKGDDQRGEQDEKEAQAIDAHQILGTDNGNPIMAFHQLEAGRGGVEISPQSESTRSGDGVEHQSDWAAIPLRPRADRERSEERDENNRRNQANHA